MENNDLKDIVSQVKNVESGVNGMIIPILKDTIEDYKKTFSKMFFIIVLQIIALLIVITYCSYLFSLSNKRYADFISQFEVQSSVYQDLDSSDSSNLTINSGINYNK